MVWTESTSISIARATSAFSLIVEDGWLLRSRKKTRYRSLLWLQRHFYSGEKKSTNISEWIHSKRSCVRETRRGGTIKRLMKVFCNREASATKAQPVSCDSEFQWTNKGSRTSITARGKNHTQLTFPGRTAWKSLGSSSQALALRGTCEGGWVSTFE